MKYFISSLIFVFTSTLSFGQIGHGVSIGLSNSDFLGYNVELGYSHNVFDLLYGTVRLGYDMGTDFRIGAGLGFDILKNQKIKPSIGIEYFYRKKQNFDWSYGGDNLLEIPIQLGFVIHERFIISGSLISTIDLSFFDSYKLLKSQRISLQYLLGKD